MNDAREMPKYVSHKTVWALKIKSIAEEDGKVWMAPEEDGYAPIELTPEYVAKHKPQAGGYYVVYPDGYKSWSPAQAFEEGYTKL